MWRLIFIAFLVAHGAIHAAIWATPASSNPDAPFDASRSWLLGSQRSFALIVALTATALLAIAGIGLWVHADWWRAVAVVGFAVSLGLMILWFNPWFSFIEVVNAALLIGLAFYAWPSRNVLGA
jgi:hypothetical protein